VSTAASAALRASLAEQLRALRGPGEELAPALLDLRVRAVELPGGPLHVPLPAQWEQLRHEEGGAGRPIPYWARLWPSGLALAAAVAEDPPAPGTRVLELGCGLALPTLVAARAGADALATDGSPDAITFAAHGLVLNELEAGVAVADWTEHGDALVDGGPWPLVLASDVLYTAANAERAARLLPRLVAPGGELRLADPGRAGARTFLAAAGASFALTTEHVGEVRLHRLTRR
jgi:predicted nicotinamide N-methyase